MHEPVAESVSERYVGRNIRFGATILMCFVRVAMSNRCRRVLRECAEDREVEVSLKIGGDPAFSPQWQCGKAQSQSM